MDDGLTQWLLRDTFGEVDPVPAAPAWFADAACLGSDIDFVEPGGKLAVQAALALCERCPVREPCGAYADAEGFTYGIWGGSSEAARAQARKDDRAA